MRDSRGRLVAEPLRRGGALCLLHARWIATAPVPVGCDRPLLAYLDLETTGLDIASACVCEIGLVEASTGAVYSSVVRPPTLPLDSGVHGIEPEELAEGPCFAEAFRRMVGFLSDLRDKAVDSGHDSSGDEGDGAWPTLRAAPPVILIAAHNGIGFDFPMLASECWRSSVPLDAMAQWLLVDTLPALRAVGPAAGECLKLQCLAKGRGSDLRAHRALDDALALRDVMSHTAASLGQAPRDLLLQFAVSVDAAATAVQIGSLLEVAAQPQREGR